MPESGFFFSPFFNENSSELQVLKNTGMLLLLKLFWSSVGWMCQVSYDKPHDAFAFRKAFNVTENKLQHGCFLINFTKFSEHLFLRES